MAWAIRAVCGLPHFVAQTFRPFATDSALHLENVRGSKFQIIDHRSKPSSGWSCSSSSSTGEA
jgi:hypothetical protein